jgi:protein O-mannosyl-transferase
LTAIPRAIGNFPISAATTSANSESKTASFGGFWPPLFIALAGMAVYANSFSVPLLFDDDSSIATNASLQHWRTAFWPPAGTTVGGRPFLNLSLALNYAISGPAVWSYHALNVAIHIFAALALYGIIRRTLAPRTAGTAVGIAFFTALLWILHPLQTGSVTYIIQRAESLMGLLYLLTLYCFIRGAQADGHARRPWFILSVVACGLGMATKEVMVSAPLIVLLYDRTFFSGTFTAAWRRRRPVYLGLAATWIILIFLVLSTKGRAGTAGFASQISFAHYALTQFSAIVHYLRLCFWPHPLIFSYGSALILEPGRVLTSAPLVIGLLIASGWALIRRPVFGFLGISFFVILAPSSSIYPIATETMAEQRLYLPLICVVVLGVTAIYRWLGRAALLCCFTVAAALFGTTWRRNQDYASPLTLWRKTVAEQPDNFYARYDLGSELEKLPGRSQEAIAQFEAALQLNPDLAEAHFALGCELQNIPGRLSDATAHYEAALRLKPDDFQAHTNLGNVLAAQGRLRDAVAQYEAALRLRPDFAEIHFNLAFVLLGLPGATGEAIEHLKAGLQLQPGNETARGVLARVVGSSR